MVDLQSQYQKIKGEINQALNNVIDSSAFINGPAVDSFARSFEKYLGVKHVIPCGNGTDALQIALMSLELEPGDEIITTTFTFISTAEVISLLGLVPVLVDIDPFTFNIDPELIEKAITPKTKVIIPVHLFGQTADMDSISKIAEKNNIFVIEDNCQAIGAEYITSDNKKLKVGTIGDIGCTSFFPSKNLGAFGDGGAIFTNNDKLAGIIRSIANHGMIKKYYHERVGINSRLDSIQAAILSVKLNYLDNYNLRRRETADYYDKAFSDIDNLICPKRSSFSTHVFHQYCLIVGGGERDKLKNYLTSKGIPSMIYYPIPVHKQKPYLFSRYIFEDNSVSEKVSDSIIALPMQTELDKEQLDYIITVVRDFFKD